MAVDPAGRSPSTERWYAGALFVSLTAFYVAVSAVLSVRYNLFDGDGPSRVAHAGFALMSRHPHLSAIGFVWNPLPSLLELPLLPLHRIWPELKTYGLAGGLQSAPFMAGAALVVRRIAIDRGVPSAWRIVAVGVFALHPMVVTYGGSGLSEAAALFFVLLCVRYLLLWLDTRSVQQLAVAGIALGLGYLARYEVIVAAAGAALFVGVITATTRATRARFSSTILNVIVLVFPLMVSFVTWALASWIMTGQMFPTLTSQYGNASQVTTALTRNSLSEDQDWITQAVRLTAMQPFAGIAVAVGVAMAIYRRRADIAVPLLTLGGILAFSIWGAYTETTFGWFRYYMPAVPMVIVVALIWLTPGTSPRDKITARALPQRLGGATLALSLVVGLPVTAVSMLNKDIGNHQLQFGLKSLVLPDEYPADEQWYRRVGVDDRILARYLDSRQLPDGAILMDTFMNWGIWLASDRPRQFIIDTDYDYTAALNRPWDFGVQYILVTNPAYNAAPDTVQMRYPTLWFDGAGIGTLVHSAQGAFGQEQWRLYRISKPDLPDPVRTPR